MMADTEEPQFNTLAERIAALNKQELCQCSKPKPRSWTSSQATAATTTSRSSNYRRQESNSTGDIDYSKPVAE
jgi:hypothetical protein